MPKWTTDQFLKDYNESVSDYTQSTQSLSAIAGQPQGQLGVADESTRRTTLGRRDWSLNEADRKQAVRSMASETPTPAPTETTLSDTERARKEAARLISQQPFPYPLPHERPYTPPKQLYPPPIKEKPQPTFLQRLGKGVGEGVTELLKGATLGREGYSRAKYEEMVRQPYEQKMRAISSASEKAKLEEGRRYSESEYDRRVKMTQANKEVDLLKNKKIEIWSKYLSGDSLSTPEKEFIEVDKISPESKQQIDYFSKIISSPAGVYNESAKQWAGQELNKLMGFSMTTEPTGFLGWGKGKTTITPTKSPQIGTPQPVTQQGLPTSDDLELRKRYPDLSDDEFNILKQELNK